VNEARFEETEVGLLPAEDGWFVLNARDAVWATSEAYGAACLLEGRTDFPQVGVRLRVLQPGQPNGRYHHEANQEDFLVLAGECLLLVEGEERRLRAWDFFHCPGGTEHIFVGAGDGPCVILMVGSREGGPEAEGLVYPVSELARRHGASVEVATDSPDEAYAGQPEWRYGPAPAGFPPA
jgi:uncharacterized cupin superfamily protein